VTDDMSTRSGAIARRVGATATSGDPLESPSTASPPWSWPAPTSPGATGTSWCDQVPATHAFGLAGRPQED